MRPEASASTACANSSWKRNEPTRSISRAISRFTGSGTAPGGSMPSWTIRPPARISDGMPTIEAAAPVASSATSNPPRASADAARRSGSARTSMVSAAPISRAMRSGGSNRSVTVQLAAPA